MGKKTKPLERIQLEYALIKEQGASWNIVWGGISLPKPRELVGP